MLYCFSLADTELYFVGLWKRLSTTKEHRVSSTDL